MTRFQVFRLNSLCRLRDFQLLSIYWNMFNSLFYHKQWKQWKPVFLLLFLLIRAVFFYHRRLGEKKTKLNSRNRIFVSNVFSFCPPGVMSESVPSGAVFPSGYKEDLFTRSCLCWAPGLWTALHAHALFYNRLLGNKGSVMSLLPTGHFFFPGTRVYS